MIAPALRSGLTSKEDSTQTLLQLSGWAALTSSFHRPPIAIIVVLPAFTHDRVQISQADKLWFALFHKKIHPFWCRRTISDYNVLDKSIRRRACNGQLTECSLIADVVTTFFGWKKAIDPVLSRCIALAAKREAKTSDSRAYLEKTKHCLVLFFSAMPVIRGHCHKLDDIIAS